METLTWTLQDHPRAEIAAAAVALLALLTWANFKGVYGWGQFRFRPDTHRFVVWAAYVGALPLRLLLALFSAAVTTFLWGLAALFLWALAKTAGQ